MPADSPVPSLSGALVVLNVVFALIWFPILDTIDDATYLFRAVFLVNLWATGWWIWMNTSVDALRLAWLISSSYEHARKNEDVSSIPPIDQRAEKRHNIRVLLYTVLFRRMREKAELERAPTLAAPPASCCDRAVRLVSEDRCTHSVPPNSMQTMISSTLPGEHDIVDGVQAPFTTFTLHAPRTSRAPCPSPDPLVRNASPHGTPTIPASAIPLSPSSDQPSAETVELHRELSASNAERDMYRTRAYGLAMRLDDCYTVHAQTTYTLERAERELAEALRALRQCEAERRDLAVALALAITATRAGSRGMSGSAAGLVQASFPVEPTSLVEPLPSSESESESEELVVYLRDQPAMPPAVNLDADATGKTYTSTREAECTSPAIERHDDRPLLLPPAAGAAAAVEGARGADKSDDSPTRSRSRVVQRASPAERPKPASSALEDLVLETQRRADLGRAMKKGPSGQWDADRAASVRARFSVVHAGAGVGMGAKGDRRGGGPPSPELPAQVEGNRIIEDLRMSRPRTSPPESPELDVEAGLRAGTEVQVQVHVERPSGVLETVPEEDSADEADDGSTDDSEECYEECEDDASPGHAPEAGVRIHLNEANGPTTPCQAKEPTMLQVPITRQPLGPPPSPNASLAEKATQRSREHTWRGRSSTTDAESLSAPSAAYPESRLPSRVRARQATAPPASMSPSLATTTPSRSAQRDAAAARLYAMLSGTGMVGEEHKRHATFSAGGRSSDSESNSNSNGGASPSTPNPSSTHASALPPPTGTPGTRWQLSALGNGAGEKLRAPARACFPFAPSSALYATVGAGAGAGDSRG
ncbi:hypothetical protein ONZ51_g11294 [Trametes cubensis]|uniref:Uncharacterized protein n=1 Tax=Trametes cubensis TaxID=1111947 RepID=A0AAD7THU8_9APHY|nr:hypothetical protein ONZ51_g11294 [Trametes cubensis]